jgi:hypothetical protein
MRLGLTLALLLAAGCTPDAPSTFGGEQKASDLPSGNGFSEGDGFDTAGAGAPAQDCPAGAQLVYVLSQENDLYSFTPNTGAFKKVGPLKCPAAKDAVPNSMAIDRQGIAWVNYDTGDLFRVSTVNASCQATGFKPNQAGFLKFGMAFATNGPDSTDETLYISGLTKEAGGGKGLGKLDLKTMKVTMLGDYSGALGTRGAELTGTGDGRLFGFFATVPDATLARIDMAKAATSEDKPLTGVATGEAWAFSFWGGDFWFYTSDGDSPSKVTQLKTSGAGELAVAKESVGSFRIVGAGVSTCAPTAPPK